MTIKIKEWKADQIIEEAHKYHLAIERRRNDDGTVEIYQTAPTLRETEKAIYIEISASTYGDRPHDFRTWIPKSCIVA